MADGSREGYPTRETRDYTGHGRGVTGYRHPNAWRGIDVPACAWGRIIGKGGETLKGLEQEYGVRLQVPKPDAPAGSTVKVRGPPSSCAECEKRIHEIVREMSRISHSSKVPKPKKQSKCTLKCGCCALEINSYAQAFEHLGGLRHVRKVQEEHHVGHVPEHHGNGSVMRVVAMLESPAWRAIHEQLGFDVDELLGAAPKLEEQRLADEALRKEVSRLSATCEWLQVTNRWFCAWDESPSADSKAVHILGAPLFEEMFCRCLVDEKPPLMRETSLPAFLPKPDPNGRKFRIAKAKHLFPYAPSSRLGIVVLLKLGLTMDDFHFVCGTSLIKALSGDPSRCRDTFYLQRCGRAICCLHIDDSFHSQDDAGHAVEQLFCGTDSKHPRGFYAASRVCIGDYQVLITSEVDARDADGNLVEVKTSSVKSASQMVSDKVALQIACNGSRHVLCCNLDKNKTQVTATEWVSADEALEAHRGSFITSGQRVRLFLNRLYHEDCFAATGSDAQVGCVMELTFDEIKAPVLKPAPAHVSVLPHGLPVV